MKTTLRNTHLSSSAIRRSSLFFSVLCAASVNAGTVAYWPLAYENGVRATTETVFDGRWHHVALTLSQENGQVTASIHKDYEATPSWTRTVSGSLCYGTGYAPVWVGASSSTTAFFNGQIDELRISRGILAPTELLRRGQLPFTLVIR